MALKGNKTPPVNPNPPPVSSIHRSIQIIEPKYGSLPPILYSEETLRVLVACGHRQFGLAITAAWFGTNALALTAFFRKHPDAREAWLIAINQGKGYMLGAQYDAARNGDTKMLEWMGKQHLGQRDKIEAVGGDQVRPTGARSKLMDAIDAEAERITNERAKSSAPQGGQSATVPKGARRLQ